MFGPDSVHQRFVDVPPQFTPNVKRQMASAPSRDHLIALLGKQRPVGYDIQHDAVPMLGDRANGPLAEFLDCFHEERSVIATRIRRALGADLRGRTRELDAVSDDDVRFTEQLKELRDSFLLAELCWALGLESARGASSGPVVVAAVEACATIGGTLLELSPDTGLDRSELQRIHHARTVWIGILLRFDEHADLIADGGLRLNDRLVALVGRTHDPARGPLARFFHIFEEDPVPLVGPRLRTLVQSAARTKQLGDSERHPGDEDRTTSESPVQAAERRSVELVEREEEQRLLDVAARLLLPRYMIDEALGLLQHLGAISGRMPQFGSSLPFWRRWAWPLLPVAAAGGLLFAIALVMLLGGLLERLIPGPTATVVAALWDRLPFLVPLTGGVMTAVRWSLVALVAIWAILSCVALYTGGRSASYLLLLRIPSATAFGLAILLALSFTWIGTQSGMGKAGPAVALLAASVYAYVEIINQGGESRRRRDGARRLADGKARADATELPDVRRGSLGRVVELTVLAGGMSLLVATLVLEVFGRTLLTQVPNYELLADPAIRLETLAILASISLALGTFLQAIWDEQTITAPLSYLRLRG